VNCRRTVFSSLVRAVVSWFRRDTEGQISPVVARRRTCQRTTGCLRDPAPRSRAIRNPCRATPARSLHPQLCAREQCVGVIGHDVGAETPGRRAMCPRVPVHPPSPASLRHAMASPAVRDPLIAIAIDNSFLKPNASTRKRISARASRARSVGHTCGGGDVEDMMHFTRERTIVRLSSVNPNSMGMTPLRAVLTSPRGAHERDTSTHLHQGSIFAITGHRRALDRPPSINVIY
jgi:hypothetical protein